VENVKGTRSNQKQTSQRRLGNEDTFLKPEIAWTLRRAADKYASAGIAVAGTHYVPEVTDWTSTSK